MSRVPNRVNVLLAHDYAEKLHRLAEQAHVSPGTLARSLLSRALDDATPDSSTMTALLDSIDGAFAQTQAGLDDMRAGRVIPLDDI